MGVNLWLDDRRPAPEGWTSAKAVVAAQHLISKGQVKFASLAHDLASCDTCTDRSKPVEIIVCGGRAYGSACGCACHLTGLDLVNWMEEKNLWPAHMPSVHSSNVSGAPTMRAAISKKFGRGAP